MRKDEIAYYLLDDGTDDQVATIEIVVPGAIITIMGETEDEGSGLVVNRAHISVEPPDAVILTRRTMAIIAERIRGDTGYEYILVRGARRTTGARPGRFPRELRFA